MNDDITIMYCWKLEGFRANSNVLIVAIELLLIFAEAKYLGKFFFGAKLRYKSLLEHEINKAIRSFWACRRMFGKTWRMKPETLHWLSYYDLCVHLL